ncbi:hypothetical protein SPRG_05165 [Saprolegnia parasitica CBS 223.65]|uniref:LisH domain-containing protein n=1 Tax=Saprolegnia parasitica (strain CBS 223.65) TaxID=695850 RepID=A0A067CTV0_SAPPC|nr:hypothetical protein SPRG_05165 [Saprolegnia parasitica CBS 223.65]KDO29976.1 hypothetical protein SPRG_05165 [Saprolegnia parasitica CBS 223.65]|eukprot:XP_012199159.1 hypothetical protein SPRG_05165 [Saprolegnia parasitica CBS 223.65]
MGSRGAWADDDAPLGDSLHEETSRRSKKVASMELVLDDEDDDHASEPSATVKTDRARPSTPATPVIETPQENDNDAGYIHDLVREFFRVHNIQAALDAFELERPSPQQAPSHATTDADLGVTSAGAPTRLEAFVMSWNQAEHGLVLAPTKKKAKTPVKKKKVLSIATPETLDVGGAPETLDLGVPGCTPKPRLADLQSFGFDDVEERPAPTMATPRSAAPVLELKGVREAKRVTLGDEGSTPKKEYIFYRQTPPSFVTETEEAAREVMEKLSLDPAYDLRPEAPPRFVELASSDVSKYDIGKRVEGLGANRDVSGVITEKHGSKLCGTCGPGTILIDTSC